MRVSDNGAVMRRYLFVLVKIRIYAVARRGINAQPFITVENAYGLTLHNTVASAANVIYRLSVVQFKHLVPVDRQIGYRVPFEPAHQVVGG